MESKKVCVIRLNVLETLTEFANTRVIYEELENKDLLTGIIDWIIKLKQSTNNIKSIASIKEHLKLILNVLSNCFN